MADCSWLVSVKTNSRIKAMNQLINNQKAEMTSREIADLAGARHDSVKRTIERLTAGAIDIPPLVENPNHQWWVG